MIRQRGSIAFVLYFHCGRRALRFTFNIDVVCDKNYHYHSYHYHSYHYHSTLVYILLDRKTAYIVYLQNSRFRTNNISNIAMFANANSSSNNLSRIDLSAHLIKVSVTKTSS